jgi:cell pole-organizing protein PopZ
MNKPAPKEPSMDEILSSIRQIIADDDAAGVPRRPTIQAAPPPMQATPARPIADSLDRDLSDMLDDIEPLALSPNQIVDKGDDDVGGFSFDSILADTAVDDEPTAAAPQLVEPDDIAFDLADVAEEEEEELPAFDPPPMAVVPPAPQPAPRPQPSVAQAAPLPDPTLSSDMADQLLGPATEAAVRNSITRLNGLGLGNAGATIESLMRDMLRPMLKEWLDENLPAVVERMVEREITRISRGE